MPKTRVERRVTLATAESAPLAGVVEEGLAPGAPLEVEAPGAAVELLDAASTLNWGNSGNVSTFNGGYC